MNPRPIEIINVLPSLLGLEGFIHDNMISYIQTTLTFGLAKCLTAADMKSLRVFIVIPDKAPGNLVEVCTNCGWNVGRLRGICRNCREHRLNHNNAARKVQTISLPTCKSSFHFFDEITEEVVVRLSKLMGVPKYFPMSEASYIPLIERTGPLVALEIFGEKITLDLAKFIDSPETVQKWLSRFMMMVI